MDLLILTINTTNNIITKMEELASTLPEYDTVRNMEGCGDKLTPRIIAEIGDIRRFKNAGLNKFIRMYYGKVKDKYKELEIW